MTLAEMAIERRAYVEGIAKGAERERRRIRRAQAKAIAALNQIGQGAWADLLDAATKATKKGKRK